MKKIVSLFIISIMICSIVGCSQKKTDSISLPQEKNIQSIDVTVGNETENFSDREWIRQCILDITNAQATTKESVQDVPQVDEYIKIDINADDAVSTLFVYIEKENYYIEQPYQGIYKTDLAFYEKLSASKFAWTEVIRGGEAL